LWELGQVSAERCDYEESMNEHGLMMQCECRWPFLFYCKRLSQQNRNLKNRHTKSGVLFKFQGCPNSSTHCYCYATMKQKTWSTSVTSLYQIHYPSPIISSSFLSSLSPVSRPSKLFHPPSPTPLLLQP